MRRRMMLVAVVRARGARLRWRHVSHPPKACSISLFGGASRNRNSSNSNSRRPPQASFFADPFGLNPQPAPPPPRPVQRAGSGPAFCVSKLRRQVFSADGARQCVTPVQMCQAFCPASADQGAFSAAPSTAHLPAMASVMPICENAFGYRKALRADCTCNGRDPAGLAPIDLSRSTTSLRSGDVIATTRRSGSLFRRQGRHSARARNSHRLLPIQA